MNRFGLPDLGLGVGLRTVHYTEILESRPNVGWFEIISENYMYTRGRPLLYLDEIAERYPIVMHGVSLSIGSTSPIDFDYLSELRTLRDRVGARWVSDHLCWTGVPGKNAHDLLPVPYTEESLRSIVDRVRIVQDFLESPLALENPSTYLESADSTFTEADFLASVAREADCALLVDVNNIHVSSTNHGFDPIDYIEALPADRVLQFHIAGHSTRGDLLIDTHIGPVIEPVWELLSRAHQRTGCESFLLEWDAEIPPFGTLLKEAERVFEYVPSLRTGSRG